MVIFHTFVYVYQRVERTFKHTRICDILVTNALFETLVQTCRCFPQLFSQLFQSICIPSRSSFPQRSNVFKLVYFKTCEIHPKPNIFQRPQGPSNNFKIAWRSKNKNIRKSIQFPDAEIVHKVSSLPSLLLIGGKHMENSFVGILQRDPQLIGTV